MFCIDSSSSANHAAHVIPPRFVRAFVRQTCQCSAPNASAPRPLLSSPLRRPPLCPHGFITPRPAVSITRRSLLRAIRLSNRQGSFRKLMQQLKVLSAAWTPPAVPNSARLNHPDCFHPSARRFPPYHVLRGASPVLRNTAHAVHGHRPWLTIYCAVVLWLTSPVCEP